MNDHPTEAEVMGRMPPEGQHAPVFRAVLPGGAEIPFTTIGEWQAFIYSTIQQLAGIQVQLRPFLELNETIMDDISQHPHFEKAVGVIRAQFAKALGEAL